MRRSDVEVGVEVPLHVALVFGLQDQLVRLAAVFVHQVEAGGAEQRHGGHGEEADADGDDDEQVGDPPPGGEQHLHLAVLPSVGQTQGVVGAGA